MFAIVSILMGGLLGGLLGFGLGRGVPALVQGGGRLARRQNQLGMGLLLMVPWLVGALLLLKALTAPGLLVLAGGYWLGMVVGRRQLGL